MQLLYIHPDGRPLCLLDETVFALLQRTAGPTSPPDLAPLPPTASRASLARRLSPAARRAPAGAAHLQRRRPRHQPAPHLFLDGHDRRMTLESWAQAVLAGQWTAPGVGQLRLQRWREVLEEVTALG